MSKHANKVGFYTLCATVTINEDSQLWRARWPGVFSNYSHVWLLSESPGLRAGWRKTWSWQSCKHQPPTTTANTWC